MFPLMPFSWDIFFQTELVCDKLMVLASLKICEPELTLSKKLLGMLKETIQINAIVQQVRKQYSQLDFEQ